MQVFEARGTDSFRTSGQGSRGLDTTFYDDRCRRNSRFSLSYPDTHTQAGARVCEEPDRWSETSTESFHPAYPGSQFGRLSQAHSSSSLTHLSSPVSSLSGAATNSLAFQDSIPQPLGQYSVSTGQSQPLSFPPLSACEPQWFDGEHTTACPTASLGVKCERDQATPIDVFPPFADYSERWAGQSAQLGDCFSSDPLLPYSHEAFSQPIQAPDGVPPAYETDALSFAHDAILSDVGMGTGPDASGVCLPEPPSWEALIPWCPSDCSGAPVTALDDGVVPMLSSTDVGLASFPQPLYHDTAVPPDLSGLFLPDFDEPDSLGAASMSELTGSLCCPCPPICPRTFSQDVALPNAADFSQLEAQCERLGDAPRLADVLVPKGESGPVGGNTGAQGSTEASTRKRGRPRRYDIPVPTTAADAGDKGGVANEGVQPQTRKRQRGAKPKYAYGTQEQAVAMRRQRNRETALFSYYKRKAHVDALHKEVAELTAERRALKQLLGECQRSPVIAGKVRALLLRNIAPVAVLEAVHGVHANGA